MTLQLLKKVALGAAVLLLQPNCYIAQDSETILNQKYWTMRERFRKYFISIGKNEGQSIPVAKRQNGNYGGNRCSNLYSNSSGWMSWGDATGYLGDYMATLATEYALLVQEGKNTAATLNELYYAINALDRLDGFAEFTFDPSKSINYNGFFLRDDVTQSTVGIWNNEYDNVGVQDPMFNYRCLDSDRQKNLNDVTRENNCTNEPSVDQIVTIFQGFSFIKKYVPNIYVKPTPQDAGFNIIDKIQAITSNIMEYASGADRQLLIADHKSELVYNQLNPSTFFFSSPALGFGIAYISDCANNDVRSNWVLINPVTHRKVGTCSEDTENQDIRPFAWVVAKIGEQLTNNTYTDRDIHHEVVDQLNDGYYCLDAHDYHIPLSWIKSHVWDALEQLPAINDEYVVVYKGVSLQTKPVCFKINNNSETIDISSLARNVYLMEALASMSGSWSHSNVNKFANQYHHENMDLIYACLNNTTPQNSQSHYIDLLSKLSCDGPRNYGAADFTSFWNNGNSFEHPTYDNFNTDTYSHGEYNANDWMWLYNMYRLKFGSSSFPSYEDVSCNCKKSPTLEANTNSGTGELNTSITLKRIFKDYLKLGISLKEFNQGSLYIQNNKTLTNETEFTICGNVYISGNGTLINTGKPTNEDSIKITVRNSSGIFVQTNGTLDVGKNTKVVIQKLGKLVSGGTNAKIIIRNGGKLIIEPGAFLELNNGGKLIVEDGGQVIIHTKIASGGNSSENGILTYNQGAEIQLKGDNAILELNGRLHIGDNATFSITYPGSNSGYIKFNRGAGVWWNNWAPNNAHITCGINSKITLIGQNKTDKMIDISQDNVAIPKNLTQLVMSKCLVEFNVGNARLETDRPTTITNSTFKGNYTPISNQTDYTRGLLVFGQQICSINGCDFKDLGTAVTGALFYGGNKLVGVRNCNFYSCNKGIVTVGAGYNISNNSFTNNVESIVTLDNVYNSLIKNNNISSTFPISTISNPNAPFNDVVRTGINVFGGTSAENEISENQINNIDNAIFVGNTEAKIKCNNIQNNMLALYGATNSKINMSSLLNSGYNTASNSSQFAFFDEANYFEANKGYNAFNVSNQSPCYQQFVSPPHNYQEICPIITNGSLVNFTLYNPIDGYYENVAEENYWRPITTTQNASIESAYNTISKINPSNQVLYNARMVTGLALSDASQIICPNNNGNGNGNFNNIAHTRIHPLDNNSGSSSINTASFYNKQLQYALQFSLTKMDDMQNANKVNEAADLFTEILKANYTLPVKNPVDKYLLDLCYQKLFNCVTLLTNWHKESSSLPLPSSLQNRYNDLFTIIDLRINRKDVLESDFKEINDLVYLDKAMIYRLLEDRNSALNTLSNIIANQPKAEHRNLYENLYCVWKTEHDAINGVITIDEALVQIENCNKNYTLVARSSSANNRILKNEEASVLTNNIDAFLNPNPTNGLLTITSKTELQKIEVMSVDGKILLSEIPTNISHTLHIDNFANGIYFVNLYQNNRVVMREKVILNK